MSTGKHFRIWSGFITGRRINKVSLEAEAWFWRIMVVADRFGYVPRDIETLRAMTIGLREGVRRAQVRRYVRELKEAGLLVDAGVSLHIVDFERTQSRTILNGQRATIPAHVRRDVLSIGYCQECGIGDNLSVDHIFPVSLGGTDDRDNLQCLCLPCNIEKSNKLEAAA